MPFFEIPELIGSLFTAILTPYKAIKDFPNKMIKKFLNFFWNFNKAIDLIWLLDIAHHCFVHFDNNHEIGNGCTIRQSDIGQVELHVFLECDALVHNGLTGRF